MDRLARTDRDPPAETSPGWRGSYRACVVQQWLGARTLIILRSLDDLDPRLRGGAVTIGNFDGVHRGHARIIESLKVMASQAEGPAIVFTFDPHPVRLLRPAEAPPPLTWTERKAELLSYLDIDAMVAYPTNSALLGLTPEEFYQSIVIDKLAAKAMVEGPNFYFGRGRAGNVDTLGELCSANQVALKIVEPLEEGTEYVSSSRVRRLVASGSVAEAADLLTRPYRIRGMVTHGAKRGTQIGFPTANLEAIDTLIPPPGVYAGRGYQDDQTWSAAIHIGPNPTFGELGVKVEVHLIGFSGSLYGQTLEVDFLARLRDIQPFDSVEALKQQLVLDVEKSRQIASQASDGGDHNSADE